MRRMMRRGLPAALLVLAFQASAGAQGAPPTQGGGEERGDDERARLLFQAGRTSYDEGRFEDALERFEAAYELSRRPALLYNVGQAADRLRRDAEAVDAFELYLAAAGEDAPHRAAVTARLEVLRRQIESERILAEAPRRRALRVGLGVGAAVVVVGAVLTAVLLATRDPKQRPPVPGDPSIGIGGIVETLRVE